MKQFAMGAALASMCFAHQTACAASARDVIIDDTLVCGVERKVEYLRDPAYQGKDPGIFKALAFALSSQ